MTQKEALKILKMGKNVFLTGAAGSGKTFVLREYITFLRKHGVEVAVTASTGIAATHLKGVTIHSWSGIGIKDNLTDYDLDELEQKSYLWKRFEKTKVLIIDEISMLSASTLDCVDQVAKVFKKNTLPFGGMQVIFSGDFFQLPPVEKKLPFQENTIFLDEEESNIPFAFKSRAWIDADLHVCYLSEQFRQQDNILVKLLSEIRDGTFSEKSIKILNNRIVEEVDDEITKLYTHNMNVDSFNNKKLQALGNPEKKFDMQTKGKANLVNALKKGCLVPECLVLKEGALVMFVKNNPIEGYINGTVGEIVGFDGTHPIVQTKEGKKFTATPQTWAIEEGDRILAEISQIPLKLAWAVTIHKSQGMTLDQAHIDLSKSFVEGQGYVALSRIKTLEGLFLKGFNRTAIEVHREIRKIDREFKKSSEILADKIIKLKKNKFEEKKENFINTIKTEKSKNFEKKEYKLATHEITQKLLEEEKTLGEIISERKLKSGTILSHIEKLLEEGKLEKTDLIYLKPKTTEFDKTLKEIREKINELGESKLTPIFKALNKKYSFEEIRFAKIFL